MALSGSTKVDVGGIALTGSTKVDVGGMPLTGSTKVDVELAGRGDTDDHSMRGRSITSETVDGGSHYSLLEEAQGWSDGDEDDEDGEDGGEDGEDGGKDGGEDDDDDCFASFASLLMDTEAEVAINEEKVNVTTHHRQKGGKKRKARAEVVINVAECEYEIVRQCAIAKGWKLCENYYYYEKDWDCGSVSSDLTEQPEAVRACTHRGLCSRYANVVWHDHSTFPIVFSHLLSFQKVNHFPGLSDYARKIGLTSKLSRMRRSLPTEYNFYPRTWILPHDASEFRREFSSQQGRSSEVFIIKPDGGCQGKGIQLTNQWADVAAFVDRRVVAQRYIRDPLLIDGLKCDLRLYVLVTSINPPRIFLHRNGLVRLCTTNYCEPSATNLNNPFMHLTNYAIQKTAHAFNPAGSKRSLLWLLEWLHSAEYSSGGDPDLLWPDIVDVVLKTMIPIVPSLNMHYRWGKGVKDSTCFALVGIDMILDSKLKPWLLEINHMPSFRTDTNVDREVKRQVIMDTLSLLHVSAADKRRYLLKLRRRRKSRSQGTCQSVRKQQLERRATVSSTNSAGRGSAIFGARATSMHTSDRSAQANAAKKHQVSAEEDRMARQRELDSKLRSHEEASKGGFIGIYPSDHHCPVQSTDYEAILMLATQLELKLLRRAKPQLATSPAPSSGSAASDEVGQKQTKARGVPAARGRRPPTFPIRRSSRAGLKATLAKKCNCGSSVCGGDQEQAGFGTEDEGHLPTTSDRTSSAQEDVDDAASISTQLEEPAASETLEASMHETSGLATMPSRYRQVAALFGSPERRPAVPMTRFQKGAPRQLHRGARLSYRPVLKGETESNRSVEASVGLRASTRTPASHAEARGPSRSPWEPFVASQLEVTNDSGNARLDQLLQFNLPELLHSQESIGDDAPAPVTRETVRSVSLSYYPHQSRGAESEEDPSRVLSRRLWTPGWRNRSSLASARHDVDPQTLVVASTRLTAPPLQQPTTCGSQDEDADPATGGTGPLCGHARTASTVKTNSHRRRGRHQSLSKDGKLVTDGQEVSAPSVQQSSHGRRLSIHRSGSVTTAKQTPAVHCGRARWMALQPERPLPRRWSEPLPQRKEERTSTDGLYTSSVTKPVWPRHVHVGPHRPTSSARRPRTRQQELHEEGDRLVERLRKLQAQQQQQALGEMRPRW